MLLLGVLVMKEFQTWLRGQLTFLLFSGLVLLTSLLVFALGFVILAPDANAAPALFSTAATTSPNPLVTNRALLYFGAVSACVLLAAAAVAPAVAASAFAGEREQGTLDLLLLQGPSAAHVVLAKLVASIAFSLLALAVAAPLFAPAWTFGGVGASQVVALLAIVLSATALFSSLGVWFGAVLPRALPAALIAQGVALFLLFGTLGLHLAVAALAGGDVLLPLLWLNPFLALVSGGGAATETLARSAPVALRHVLVLPGLPVAPGVEAPAWVVASVAWVALSAGLALAASVAIDPCHPLRRRRPA